MLPGSVLTLCRLADHHLDTKAAEDAADLRSWIDSDQALLDAVNTAKAKLQEALIHASKAVKVVQAIQRLSLRGAVASSSLYTKAVSGALDDSPVIRELLLAVKKTPSDVLTKMLSDVRSVCSEDYHPNLTEIKSQLDILISENESDQPMRSEHDIRNDTLRTTVVAQKVQLPYSGLERRSLIGRRADGDRTTQTPPGLGASL